MRILRRYFFLAIGGTTLLVLAVLLSLGAFIQFIGELNDIGTGDYGLPQALVWILLKLPNVLFQMLPIATLLGALLGLGNLASRSEFIVLRAAGISPAGLARAAGMTGIVLAAAALLLGEAVGPPLERYARQFRAEAKYGQAGLDTGRSAWIRDGSTLLNVVAPTGEPGVGGVYLFRKGDDGWLDSVGRADSIHVEPDGSWVLDNYAESRFVEAGVEAGSRGSPALRGLNRDLLALAEVREETLSGAALFRYIRYLQRNGLESRRYEVAFWARISTALAVAVMCVLAVPFVLGALRSGGAGARMLTGLGIGLAWFLMARTLTDGGAVWGLSPLLVAWLPTALLAAAAGVALARVR